MKKEKGYVNVELKMPIEMHKHVKKAAIDQSETLHDYCLDAISTQSAYSIIKNKR